MARIARITGIAWNLDDGIAIIQCGKMDTVRAAESIYGSMLIPCSLLVVAPSIGRSSRCDPSGVQVICAIKLDDAGILNVTDRGRSTVHRNRLAVEKSL